MYVLPMKFHRNIANVTNLTEVKRHAQSEKWQRKIADKVWNDSSKQTFSEVTWWRQWNQSFPPSSKLLRLVTFIFEDFISFFTRGVSHISWINIIILTPLMPLVTVLCIISLTFTGLPSSESLSALVWLFSGQQPYTMCFRVKFYPQEPIKIKEELTR